MKSNARLLLWATDERDDIKCNDRLPDHGLHDSLGYYVTRLSRTRSRKAKTLNSSQATYVSEYRSDPTMYTCSTLYFNDMRCTYSCITVTTKAKYDIAQ